MSAAWVVASALAASAAGQVPQAALTLPPGHAAGVSSVAFSPDGKLLATGGKDKTVRVWEVGGWRPLHTLHEHDAITRVAFQPDGKALLWQVGPDVRVWDLEGR